MNSNINNSPFKNSTWLVAWTKEFCNATLLYRAGIVKRSGHSAVRLLRLFLGLPFSNNKIWRFQGEQNPLPERSAFYEFLAQKHYNWELLVFIVAQRVITFLTTLTTAGRKRVLILDDSPYKRDRSKKVELLGRHHDHNDNTTCKGFRMLSLAWSDGHSLIPLGFELLSNADNEKRIGAIPDYDGRTRFGKRCKRATQKTVDVASALLKRVAKNRLQADYLVCDSWFSFPKQLSKLSTHLPVACMLKDLPAISYLHGQRIYSLKRLYQKVNKTSRNNAFKDSPIIGSIRVQMLSGPTVRVVFVRDQSDPEKWLAIASTDCSLSPKQVCRIYAKRWAIEVFFKQTKQELGLATEVQVRSYAGLLAHTSIVYLRYIMLAYYHRQQTDDKTIPGLFHAFSEELKIMSMTLCLQIILLELTELLLARGQVQLCGQLVRLFDGFYDRHPMLARYSLALECLTVNPES
ncbi:MAG: transposase [Balneolaceae bacterium]|nr:transposase [Balneolaceae bacterium]